jgi:hypothetical protein
MAPKLPLALEHIRPMESRESVDRDHNWLADRGKGAHACVTLTAAQHRELKKVAGAPGGCSEGKGAEWSVRARLRAAGLLELRKILRIDRGKLVAQHGANMWFITDAGRAALRPSSGSH